MNKEQKLLNKAKKLALKLIKFGAKLDELGVPFSIDYKNGTQLQKEKNNAEN